MQPISPRISKFSSEDSAMMPKLKNLEDAVSAIPDGACIALGGNTLHRGPGAAVHELVRQGKRELEIALSTE